MGLDQLKVNFSIESRGIVEENILLIHSREWFQEDIQALADYIFTAFHEINKGEHTLGADRESYQCSWHNAYYTLSFEYYSQSIWFSSTDQHALEQLPKLNLYISETLAK